MERKCNGKFMKKCVGCKVEWKLGGNEKEMEWKERETNDITKWIWKWNGMEMEFWRHTCGISPLEFCEVFINSTKNRSIKFHSIPWNSTFHYIFHPKNRLILSNCVTKIKRRRAETYEKSSKYGFR